MGFATVDTSRKLRHGTCEVIYGEGKNREQTEKIITALFDSGEKTVIVTRIDKDKAEKFENAKAVIAIAGMEGALASVIGGLAPCPVIAVPTSVGYGASFGGVGALLSMLNSCASNVSTVNIDSLDISDNVKENAKAVYKIIADEKGISIFEAKQEMCKD